MVKAARMVPIPSPSICPNKNSVSSAVIARQVTSKVILILAYSIFMMALNSRGNKSVGIIGRPQRLDQAMPMQIKM